MLRPMGLRCLIVDDSPGFLQAARALLEQEGMTVVGVASTSEAGEFSTPIRQCPDVTLVDIDLGGSSGVDLARRLVERMPAAAAGCLILISAHAEEEFADLIEASSRGRVPAEVRPVRGRDPWSSCPEVVAGPARL